MGSSNMAGGSFGVVEGHPGCCHLTALKFKIVVSEVLYGLGLNLHMIGKLHPNVPPQLPSPRFVSDIDYKRKNRNINVITD